VRPSGTEPLVRYYAEGHSLAMVNELLEEARKLR
jgi:phosphomannomutase